MKVGIAQINTTVGDFPGNSAAILAAYRSLVTEGAELVLTPELSIPGYPPQDLIFAGEFVDRNLAALAAIHTEVGEVPLVVGFIDRNTTGHGKPFHALKHRSIIATLSGETTSSSSTAARSRSPVTEAGAVSWRDSVKSWPCWRSPPHP